MFNGLVFLAEARGRRRAAALSGKALFSTSRGIMRYHAILAQRNNFHLTRRRMHH
jgi:hypothetical protein